ncbi:MAG: YciI family protein [Roseiflexaceae bacterium]
MISIIKLTIVVDRAAYEPYLPAHLAYLQELKARGVLLLSGPFADRTGGMVVIQAASRAEAEAIAQADPLVANQVDTYELREWLITEGQPEDIVVQRGP